ncbi:hypothetical protein AGMMS50293_24090 [Spirochaetia bacterium]|nr:hypothetical protein AGMMS50293_24090 [Spirochaetia bacterium]
MADFEKPAQNYFFVFLKEENEYEKNHGIDSVADSIFDGGVFKEQFRCRVKNPRGGFHKITGRPGVTRVYE